MDLPQSTKEQDASGKIFGAAKDWEAHAGDHTVTPSSKSK